MQVTNVATKQNLNLDLSSLARAPLEEADGGVLAMSESREYTRRGSVEFTGGGEDAVEEKDEVDESRGFVKRDEVDELEEAVEEYIDEATEGCKAARRVALAATCLEFHLIRLRDESLSLLLVWNVISYRRFFRPYERIIWRNRDRIKIFCQTGGIIQRKR